jgi:hypothetical protein
MFRFRFISVHWWLLLALGAVFIKIYQHNLFIKTMYEYQRLSRSFAQVEKERNDLLIVLYERQNPIKLMQEAEGTGLRPLSLDTIICSTQVAMVDFLGTASTSQALALCGLSYGATTEKVKQC